MEHPMHFRGVEFLKVNKDKKDCPACPPAAFYVNTLCVRFPEFDCHTGASVDVGCVRG